MCTEIVSQYSISSSCCGVLAYVWNLSAQRTFVEILASSSWLNTVEVVAPNNNWFLFVDFKICQTSAHRLLHILWPLCLSILILCWIKQSLVALCYSRSLQYFQAAKTIRLVSPHHKIAHNWELIVYIELLSSCHSGRLYGVRTCPSFFILPWCLGWPGYPG